ncbi:hypothetical protein [Candidatus Spongiihabitans sp.]|uniref:hypothetical protein n=1 Tax=Candidatus Spongiihabitans sp. TaxID=3101308 RepID=UPI003C700594
MNSLSTIIFLGGRVVLASIIGLTVQIIMLVTIPDHLLTIHEGMKTMASRIFDTLNVQSQYPVAYNLTGGDNIIVHTFFVLVAYVGILILLLLFKSSKPARSKDQAY